MVSKLSWGILSGVIVGAILGSVFRNTELFIVLSIGAGVVISGALHFVDTRAD